VFFDRSVLLLIFFLERKKISLHALIRLTVNYDMHYQSAILTRTNWFCKVFAAFNGSFDPIIERPMIK
jgi:hypothetical protein